MIRWTIQSHPRAGALPARCDAALGDLRAAPEGERLAALADPRPLHARLFADLAPPGLPEAAGTWRGDPGPLRDARRAVFVSARAPGLLARHVCAPPGEVAGRMARLAARTARDWEAGTGGRRALAAFWGDLLAIHPFLDGNGHVGRLLALVLADRLGLEAEGWSVHRRPYGPTMSLCLQWRGAHPDLLEDHLGRWFREG